MAVDYNSFLHASTDNLEVDNVVVTGDGASDIAGDIRPAAGYKYLIFGVSTLNIDDTATPDWSIEMYQAANQRCQLFRTTNLAVSASIENWGYEGRSLPWISTRNVYCRAIFGGSTKIANTKTRRLNPCIMQTID